jgi:hypothetical protein
LPAFVESTDVASGEAILFPPLPLKRRGFQKEAFYDCAWHGPMRESTKTPGTWFCPKRKADGSFCHSRWPVRAGEQSA